MWSGTSRRKRQTAAPTTAPAVVANVAAQKEKGVAAGTRIRAKHPARCQLAMATPAAIAENSAIGPGSAGVGRRMNRANKVNRLMWPKLTRPPFSSRTPPSSPPLRQHRHRRSLLEFQVIPRQHSSWHPWRRPVNASSWWRRKSSLCSTMRKSAICTDGSSTPKPPTTRRDAEKPSSILTQASPERYDSATGRWCALRAAAPSYSIVRTGSIAHSPTPTTFPASPPISSVAVNSTKSTSRS